MKLKPDEIVIDSDNVFVNDKLNRRPEIEPLTNLVMNVKDPLVLALDASWGTGKTSFVHLWQAHLKQQGKHSFVINAWETDFSEDPLVVMLSQLKKWANESTNTNLKTMAEKAQKIALPLLQETVKAGLKFATFGALDLEAAQEKVLADLSESYANKAFEQFEKSQSALDEFKALLSTLHAELDSNLVIFVDELDRCRPSYALEVLERIKHLFAIPGIVFVLSVDKKQLANSIKAVYGQDFDSTAYLNRFIDLSYTPKNEKYESYYDTLLKDAVFVEFEKARAGFHEIREEFSSVKRLFKSLCIKFNLSLRDANQIILDLKLSVLSTEERAYLFPHLLLVLIFMKRHKPELYDAYFKSSDAIAEIVSLLKSANITEPELAVCDGEMYRGWFHRGTTDKNSYLEQMKDRNNDRYGQGFNWVFHEYASNAWNPIRDVIKKRIEFGSLMRSEFV